MRILVVDDERLIRSVIKDYVELEGFICDEADDGNTAIKLAEENHYDLIVMDIMMPHTDGFEAIKTINNNKSIPTIILSARKEEVDKLQGFDLGIDDYVTKPFSPKELVARIKAVTKRNKTNEVLSVGNIVLNNVSRELMIDNEYVEVTHTQFELLSLFLNNQGRALSREAIISNIWGYNYEADDRTIDAHVKLLRSKLGRYRNSIKTIRKIGYKFEYEEE